MSEHSPLLIASITIFVILFLLKSLGDTSFAISPSFGHQEDGDPIHDVIDINCLKTQINKHVDTNICKNKNESSTHRPIDIVAINYLSDGKILNATLWFPPNDNLSSTQSNDSIIYGILIDADLNQKTGSQGIDYQVDISHKDGKWERTFNETTLYGYRTLNLIKNYNIFQKNNTNYISLYLNLTDMGSPDKYKIMFYAEDNTEKKDLIDFSNWIYVPLEEYLLLASPNPVVLMQDQRAQFNLQLLSPNNNDIVPQVSNFSIGQTYANIKVDSTGSFTNNDAGVYISVLGNASPGTYNIPVFIQLNKTSTLPGFDNTLSYGYKNITINLPINITHKMDAIESMEKQLGEFNNTLIQPLSGIYSFLGGLLTGGASKWMYKKINKR